VPELRDACFYRRWFFHRKTARFDFAVVSVLAAALLRNPVPLAGTVPYLAWVAEEAARFGGREGAEHALGSVVADAVTSASLVAGSVESRCPLF
jgi:hypothetical protein